jgi:dTMP kinase
MAPGILIAIDGIDGAGKTTLANHLAGCLPSSFEVVVTKEPTDGPWGRQLRASASSGRHDAAHERHLLTMDRREHVDTLIAPALARGVVVVLDRYVYSTAAYQSDTLAEAEQILLEQFAFAPVPDLTLIIDTPVDQALGRFHSRGDVANHFERADTLNRCREVFVNVVARRPEVRVVDGSQPADTVLEHALRYFLNAVGDRAQDRFGFTPSAAEWLMPLFAAR